ncbi:MAG: protoporphyrinogen oxidase [Elusimicrobiota bacterium]
MSEPGAGPVVVLGAGITGLSAAYDLARAGRSVVVLEASDRIGGKVRTEERDGALFETGPDSFLAAKPHAVELIKELGLSDELVGTNPLAKTIWVYTRGALRAMPEGLSLILPTKILPFLRSDLMSLKGRLRMGLEPFAAEGEPGVDESVASFFRRRLGPEAADLLVAPMLAGIFAADAEQLSLQSTFPQFLQMEKQGGLLRAMWAKRRASSGAAPAGFMTLKGGLSSLIAALAARLPPGSLRLSEGAVSLRRLRGGWQAATAKGVYEAEAVVSALPAWALAETAEDLDPELACVLREIPFASSATVTLAYARKDIPHPLDGYGFLVPRSEKRALSGVTFLSTKFPQRAPEGVALIRCFLGGAGREADVSGDEAQVARLARTELRQMLGLGEAHPLWSRVARWPRANPQFNVGHGLRLARIESCLRAHPGLILAGSSYRGVGLPDCINSGRKAAAQARAAASGAVI